MPQKAKQESTKFIVDLGPVRLPSSMIKELEAEIQSAALSTLARVDYRGDIHIGGLPPGIWGFIFDEWPPVFWPGTFDDDQQRPPAGGQGAPQVRVTSRDHLMVMRSIMENPLPILKRLDGVRRDGRRPTGIEVIGAAAEAARGPLVIILEAILEIIRDLGKVKLPRASSAALEEINKRIDAASDVDTMLATLRELQRSERFGKIEGASAGFKVAMDILQDGRSSIYADDYQFYEDYGTTATAKSAIIQEDIKGAVGGAMTGALVGVGAGGVGAGPGAATGAAVGATTASAAQAVAELWDWIWS